MDTEERFNLIKRNTQEILTEDELKQLLKDKKHPKGYIGLATTGRVHIGYLIPMMKVADFLRAGFHFKILLADIHAHLDDQKAPFDLLDHRVEYYKHIIEALLQSVGADTKNLEFVRGSDFELDKKYTLDMYKLAALNTFDRTKRAAAGVVRFGENPKLSGFIYPILQALDEQYLDVDVQFGGIDQRKILAFARENLPRIGYKARIEIMTPMLPGLKGSKMSSSEEGSKIDLLDDAETIKKKVNGAHCPIAIEDNGVLAFTKHVIFVTKQDKGEQVIIKRPEKWGGNLTYENYESLEKDFLENKLHPQDLKAMVAEEINAYLEPVRKKMHGKEKLLEKAFPPQH
jgi:tyrosyl-tRNA synthetase